jgi:hypothetical protein
MEGGRIWMIAVVIPSIIGGKAEEPEGYIMDGTHRVSVRLSDRHVGRRALSRQVSAPAWEKGA